LSVQNIHDQVLKYLYYLQKKIRHMLNKFDNKRQGEVRVFRAREGTIKGGWHYIRFRVQDDVCETSMTVTQHHIILHPRMVHDYVHSKLSLKSLLFKGDAAVGSLRGVIGRAGGTNMQRRPTDARTERWGARLRNNYVCFLVLCPHCIQFESDANRAAIGMDLE
jgi:hypothetical protein